MRTIAEHPKTRSSLRPLPRVVRPRGKESLDPRLSPDLPLLGLMLLAQTCAYESPSATIPLESLVAGLIHVWHTGDRVEPVPEE